MTSARSWFARQRFGIGPSGVKSGGRDMRPRSSRGAEERGSRDPSATANGGRRDVSDACAGFWPTCGEHDHFERYSKTGNSACVKPRQRERACRAVPFRGWVR